MPRSKAKQRKSYAGVHCKAVRKTESRSVSPVEGQAGSLQPLLIRGRAPARQGKSAERDGGRSAAMQKNKDAVHCKAFELWHEMRSLGSVFVQDGTALFARQTVPEPFLLSRRSSWKDCSDKLDLLA